VIGNHCGDQPGGIEARIEHAALLMILITGLVHLAWMRETARSGKLSTNYFGCAAQIL
jgi:hypothetical protein